MPTAQEYLRSDKPTAIVFEVITDNTKPLNADYPDWVGGKSGLAYDLGVDSVENDSQLYLSTGQVNGLASNIVVVGELWIERALGAPFTEGFSVDYGKIGLACEADELNLFKRDWYNRPFTMYIGYEGGDWADFVVLYTGKTLDNTIQGETIQIDLSINPVGLDNEFPTDRYSDGRVKPHLFGIGKQFRPIKVNLNADDGLYQFHNGTPTLTAPELDNPPYINLDLTGDTDYFGEFTYNVTYNGTTEQNTATNALPSNLTHGDGSVVLSDGVIKMTLPDIDSGGALNESCRLDGDITVDSGGSHEIDYVIEFDLSLDSTSSVDTRTINLFGHGVNSGKATLDKSVQTFTLKGTKPAATNDLSFSITAAKTLTENAEDIVVNVSGVRLVARSTLTTNVVVNNSDSSFIRSFRVPDATALSVVLPPYIAAYDDAGYIATSPNNDIVMDATGDTNDDLVSACQYISTQANGTNSPITSSITSPDIGVYISEPKRWIDHVRAMVNGADCFLQVDDNGNNIDIKRRFNGQPVDADGNINSLSAFAFDDDDITELNETPAEATYKKYVARYLLRLDEIENSPTATDTNVFSRSNDTRIIDTPFVNESDAQVIAGLVARDGAPRRMYQFTVEGSGHGIKPNDVGTLEHRKTKKGLLTIRSVREYLLSKKTTIRGVKNG